MEDPLLTKSEGDSSSNDEHIVDMTADEQTLDEAEGVEPSTCAVIWNVIQFFLTWVQIVAVIVVVTLAKDDHLQVWIIYYTCGCIATLPILCWRFWCCISLALNTRINKLVDIWEKVLEYFFVGWFVLFVWYLANNLSSLDTNKTQNFWLCMAFLAFSFIRYVLSNILIMALWLFFISGVIVRFVVYTIQPLVQIVAAIIVLTLARDEHPQVWIMVWIIGYTCGCIATLCILCWRRHKISNTSYELVREIDEWTKMLEYFFVGWFVLFVWYLVNHLPSLYSNATQHLWLSLAFFALSLIQFVLPNIKIAAYFSIFLVSVILEEKLISFLVDIFL